MKNETTLQNGSIFKLIISLSLPVVLIMLINVIYNMADTFFIGRSGDTAMVAAVSLVGPLFSVASALNTLFGFGSCTAAGIALGKGDTDSVRKYSSFCLYSSLLTGTILAVLMILFCDPLLKLLGVNSETEIYAVSYLKFFAVGVPFMITSGSLGNLIRATGDSKSAVAAMLSGTIVNIVLDPICISVLRGGVAGAAIATVLGNIVGFIMILHAVMKNELLSVRLSDLTFKKDISFTVISLGFPMAASTLLMSFSGTFSNRLMVSHGNATVAAFAVAGKAGMLVGMMVMGICIGVQPAVSYAYGKKDSKRLYQVVIGTMFVAVIVSLVLGTLLVCFRERFILAFLNDPEIIEIGKKLILLNMISAPINAVYQMCQVYLQGTGKVSYATLTGVMQKGLIYIPVLYMMHMFLGLNGLIAAGLITDVISTTISMLLCLRWGREMTKCFFIITQAMIPEI